MQYTDLAARVDYHLSSPLMTEEQVHSGCMLARRYGVRGVVVRPCDLDLAKDWVEGSGVRLGSRSSAEAGDSTTSVKQFELRDMMRRGAIDIEAKLSLPKMMSRQFQYVEVELTQLVKACVEKELKLIVSTDLSVLDEEHVVFLCKIAKRAAVTAISATEYRPDQVATLLKKTAPHVAVKLMVDGKSLEEVIRFQDAGVARFGVRHPGPLLDAWKQHLDSSKQKLEPQIAVLS